MTHEARQKAWIFPDTHMFLHYKSMKMWNLAQLVSGEPAVVCTVEVIRELDKHKHKNDRRLAKRAQKAQKLIKEVRTGQEELGFSLLVSAKDPATAAREQGLDSESADQRILSLVLEWAADHSDDDVVLLTGDHGLQLMAEDPRVRVVEPPTDWAIFEEDPRERKIKELEAKLDDLRNQSADLVLNVAVNPINERKVEESAWRPEGGESVLTQARADELAKELREAVERNWRMMPFGRGRSKWPAEKIQELDDFEDAYAKHLIEKGEYERDVKSCAKLDLSVENKGGATALDVDVFLRVLSGGEFLEEDDLPMAPKEPVIPDPPGGIAHLARLAQGLGIRTPISPALFGPRHAMPPPNIVGPYLLDSKEEARYHIRQAKHSMEYSLDDVFVKRRNPTSTVVIEYSILGSGPGEVSKSLIKIGPDDDLSS